MDLSLGFLFCSTDLYFQTVKNLPVMQETWVQSLGQEGPLEKGMAIHSSVLAWRITWTEEPEGLQSVGLQRVIISSDALPNFLYQSIEKYKASAYYSRTWILSVDRKGELPGVSHSFITFVNSF